MPQSASASLPGARVDARTVAQKSVTGPAVPRSFWLLVLSIAIAIIGGEVLLRLKLAATPGETPSIAATILLGIAIFWALLSLLYLWRPGLQIGIGPAAFRKAEPPPPDTFRSRLRGWVRDFFLGMVFVMGCSSWLVSAQKLYPAVVTTSRYAALLVAFMVLYTIVFESTKKTRFKKAVTRVVWIWLCLGAAVFVYTFGFIK